MRRSPLDFADGYVGEPEPPRWKSVGFMMALALFVGLLAFMLANLAFLFVTSVPQ